MAGTITVMLEKVHAGVPGAADALMNRVYPDLRSVARSVLGARRNGTLSATTLVDSAWERLTRRGKLVAKNRAHFFFLFHRAMMDEFIEYQRAAGALKRNKGRRAETLCEMPGKDGTIRVELIDLADAMIELESADPISARVVVLKYFAQYTMPDIAAAMEMPEKEVLNQWEYAKAWLHARLSR